MGKIKSKFQEILRLGKQDLGLGHSIKVALTVRVVGVQGWPLKVSL